MKTLFTLILLALAAATAGAQVVGGPISVGSGVVSAACPTLDSTGKFVQSPCAIPFSLGDPANSAALTTSQFAIVTVPRACTISGYDLSVDTGTVTVKFMKVATGTAIPTLGSNSISTSGVSISTGTAIHSTSTSDFTTTAISAFDVVGMQITAATAKAVWVTLECK